MTERILRRARRIGLRAERNVLSEDKSRTLVFFGGPVDPKGGRQRYATIEIHPSDGIFAYGHDWETGSGPWFGRMTLGSFPRTLHRIRQHLIGPALDSGKGKASV